MSFLSSCRSYWRMRCPRCEKGPIYLSAFVLHPRCPECGLLYEREPGYFVGSMYISYTYAFIVLGFLTLIGHLMWPDADLGWVVLGAIAVFIPLAPATTRYSRILWIYLDRLIWPESTGKPE